MTRLYYPLSRLWPDYLRAGFGLVTCLGLVLFADPQSVIFVLLVGLSLLVNLLDLVLQLCGVKVPYGVAGGTLALLASLAVFLGVSLLSRPPQIDADVEAVMDM